MDAENINKTIDKGAIRVAVEQFEKHERLLCETLDWLKDNHTMASSMIFLSMYSESVDRILKGATKMYEEPDKVKALIEKTREGMRRMLGREQ